MGASAARKEARKRKFGHTFKAENSHNHQVDESKELPEQVDRPESTEKVNATDEGVDQDMSDEKILSESVLDFPNQATKKRAKISKKVRRKFILFVGEFSVCPETPPRGIHGLGLTTHTYGR